MDSMLWPILVMVFIIAPIGGIDAVYFHLFKYRLYQNPDSRLEQLTHIARSFVLGVVMLILVGFEPQGGWFWVVGGLLAFDFLNNLIDVSLEYASRARLGGLARPEYIVHIVGASGMGGVSFSYFCLGWGLQDLPTALSSVQHHPMIMINGYLVALGAFALGGVELVLTLEHRARPADAAIRP